jgi:hypothetical protein
MVILCSRMPMLARCARSPKKRKMFMLGNVQPL